MLTFLQKTFTFNLLPSLLLIFFSVDTGFGQNQEKPQGDWSITPMVGYQGAHQQGGFTGLVFSYKSWIATSLTYGNDDLNSLSFSGNWFVNEGESQIYLKAGASRFWLIEQDNYKYRLTSAHTGIGFQSIFFENFVVNSEILALKYIRQSYSTPDFKIKNEFHLDENYFFLLGITIGYRFFL